MLAWRVHELGEPAEVLRLEEVPDPVPRAGQVLIEVEAAALNFPDVLLCRGGYQRRPRLPFTPGGEVAGRVVAVGDDVRLPVGERVLALPGAGFAERVIAPELAVFPLGDLALDWPEAAALPVAYQTAFAALHVRGGLREGETVLVHAAAGGVGSAAVQLAVAAGARVIATAGGKHKTDACLANGAAVAIDYHGSDIVESVRDATDGAGVDLIVDPVGGVVLETSLKCLAFEGRVVLVGFASGDIPEIPANRVLLKNISIVGLHWGLYATERPALLQEVHRQIVRLAAEDRIRPVLYGEFGWGELPALLQQLGDGKTWGKVIVRPDGHQ
ncbi:MAG: NADPH:quinone oxidoreductase family protein [Actinomycetota bacterium]